ncbi:ATP-grasp domain-containing protein [Pseudomonas protegens]|uniref:ATP-grasp domain-containing protein n=1 Tax=Pseudomonas protegens TaxID=380021 RepID=UPI0024C4167B|nr:ATP-grasp domain-containing protein [Pseudomonas protegens]MDK1400040.1 ATP-grasp domain-containing protein [Pseudomonas protegens]
MKRNILVFPCGSEIALEIYHSLKYNRHFNLIGASSVNDHGRFVYENYIDTLPFFDSEDFYSALIKIIAEYEIDAIYPAMDAVAVKLKEIEDVLPCLVIGSSVLTTAICGSKLLTYQKLQSVVPLPEYVVNVSQITQFPVFIKPAIGYGSRNQIIANDESEVRSFVSKNPDVELLFCEVLTGLEFTVDCFSNKKFELMYSKPRLRSRVSNGISVNTYEYDEHRLKIYDYAKKINDVLRPRGAWFFQMKLDRHGHPRLLEVASRLGGSSSLFRMKGVNFAALTLYDYFDFEVEVLENQYRIELDRALSSRYRLEINFEKVYLDYDDCVIIDGKVNSVILAFAYECIASKKGVFLITRHAGNLDESLKTHRISEVFDKIIHITDGSPKSKFIEKANSIFIDDSHAERSEVYKSLEIPVFSPDMVDALISQ